MKIGDGNKLEGRNQLPPRVITHQKLSTQLYVLRLLSVYEISHPLNKPPLALALHYLVRVLPLHALLLLCEDLLQHLALAHELHLPPVLDHLHEPLLLDLPLHLDFLLEQLLPLELIPHVLQLIGRHELLVTRLIQKV